MSSLPTSSQFDPKPQPQSKVSAASLLADLKSAHALVRERIVALGTIAANPLPSRMEYTAARLRLSQASIDRRAVLARVLKFLEERGGSADVAAVARVRMADGELIAHSVAHLAKWTSEAVSADWRGYCDASQSMRDHMSRTIEAEAAVLNPVLGR